MKTPLPTPSEVDGMVQEYLNEIRKEIPALILSGDMEKAMNDAFKAGINAILLRNMPAVEIPKRKLN